MKPLSLTAQLSILGLGLTLFAACGDKDGGGDSGDGDTDADTDADTDTDATDTDTDTDTDGTDTADTDTDTDTDGTDTTDTDTDTDGTDTTDTDTDTDTDTTVEDTTVQEIQDGTVSPGSTVTLFGVIAASESNGSGFFIVEPGGGAGSGLWVYHGSDIDIDVTRGDMIDVTGTTAEYATSAVADGTLTELEVFAEEDVTVTGTGTVPDPVVVTVADLADGDTAEAWEGSLVRVESVEVTNSDLGFGEWEVDSSLRIDDLFADPGAIAPGDTFEAVVGFVHYGFGDYKLIPRDGDDFIGFEGVPCAADKCIEDLAVGDLVITELLIDAKTGSDDYCEWFELYNTTGGTVDLNGLVVADDDTSTGSVSVETIVAADSYAVLAKSSEASWSTECTEMYAVMTIDAWYGSGPSIANSGDPLYIQLPDGTSIDEIPNHGGGNVSWQLDSSYLDATSNDDAAYWCESTTELAVDTDDSADIDYGTPGAANLACALD